MQGWIRAIRRFFYFIFYTIIHIAGYAFDILSGMSRQEASFRFRKKWLSHVPAAIGLNISIEGKPFDGPCLIVANHVSYLDPFAILLYVDASVVSKADVLKWPLIGFAGSLAGTIFVNREKKTSRAKAANAIQEALEKKISIIVFPEGTTSSGSSVLPFRPRSFQSADFAGVPVQPVAIKYDAPEVPFIGADTFLPHFFRLFRLPVINGKVTFGPLLIGSDTCSEAREWIESKVCANALAKVL